MVLDYLPCFPVPLFFLLLLNAVGFRCIGSPCILRQLFVRWLSGFGFTPAMIADLMASAASSALNPAFTIPSVIWSIASFSDVTGICASRAAVSGSVFGLPSQDSRIFDSWNASGSRLLAKFSSFSAVLSRRSQIALVTALSAPLMKRLIFSNNFTLSSYSKYARQSSTTVLAMSSFLASALPIISSTVPSVSRSMYVHVFLWPIRWILERLCSYVA